MEKLRARIDDNPKEFEKLIGLLDSQDEFKLDGPEYSRQKQAPTPKTREWYNKKSFSLIHFGGIGDELFTREFADRLVSGYAFLMPFYDYFGEEKAMLDIFEIFRVAANPEKAAPMSAYMRDQFPFLGIPTPERKRLSRDFLKSRGKESVDWNFVFECWQQPEREFQYLAKDYLAKISAILTPADIPNFRELIITESWWDTVDGLDVIVGDIALRYPEANDILLAWSVDDNFWLRRLAIDHQLTRRDKTDTPLLERILVNNFGQTEFFINKAIGWALRDYSKTNPNWVRDFIRRHRSKMASLSIKEASKYI
jgi:3-methyladenine DNA glycosylase AlkD